MNLRAQGRNRGRLFRVVTPEQAKNWPAYEAAFRAVAKLRRERMEAGPERPSDPVQRMRQRAEVLSVMGAALSRLADAQRPLYNSLDEDQKRQFATLPQMFGDQSDMYQRSLRNDDRRSWRGHRLGEGRGGDQLLRRWQCGFL